MKLTMAFSAGLAILVCSSATYACDKDVDSTPESTCVIVKRGDVPGVWFELKTADELRKAKLTVPELKLQIESLEKIAEIRDYQLDHYARVMDLQVHALGAAKDGYAQAVRMAEVAAENEKAAQRELSAWYRQPALWAGVGALAVGLLTIGLR